MPFLLLVTGFVLLEIVSGTGIDKKVGG